MRRHIWTNLSIALAILTWMSGFQTLSGNIAGEIILLSALACRSANKRRLMEVQSTKIRIVFEFVLVAVMALLVILQNDKEYLIATDPFPNVVIPFVCFVFYLLAFYKARNYRKIDEVVKEQ